MAIKTVQVFTGKISLADGKLNISIPTQKRGTRTINVPLEQAFALGLPDNEATLLNGIENEILAEKQSETTFTLEDLKVLKSICDKLEAHREVKKTTENETIKSLLHGPIGGYLHAPGGDRNAHNLGEFRVTRAQNLLANLEDEYWDVQYDIPQSYDEEGNDIGGVVANPSYWMWAYGVRKTWSVWVLPKSKYNDPVIQNWITKCREAGVRIRANRWHPDDIQLLKNLAIDELELEVRRLHTELIKALDKADKALGLVLGDETAGEATRDTGEKVCQNAYKTAIKRSTHYLNNAIKAAELYDVTMEVTDLFLAVRDALQSEYEAVNARLIKSGRQPMRLAF